MTIFDYLKIQSAECGFSGHTCNKTELWRIADEFDDITCPRTCCRNCDVRLCGVRCNGSEEPKVKRGPSEMPPSFLHLDEEWQPIGEKIEGITRTDRLEVCGQYRSMSKYAENGFLWSRCPAYYDGKEIIATDVPWDIPRPVWKYWRLIEKVYDVDIRGLCDDAYCPKCGAELDEYKYLDCEKCPHCGVRITWDSWHRANDEDNERIFGEDWIKYFKKGGNKDGDADR